MPITSVGKCCEFRKSLSRREIRSLVSDPGIRILQTCEPPEPRTWRLLNEELFPRRPDLKLRVYGLQPTTWDLSFVSGMTNVRRFAADSLLRTENLDCIGDLQDIEELAVGSFDLTSLEFLRRLSPTLRSLTIGSSKSRKPDLAPLGRFTDLRTLYLEGQQKNIEVLSELRSLEDVTLRSISTPGLDYLAPLRHLWSVDIKLGGIRDLSAIGGMPAVKYLEIWQVRGFEDLSVVSELPGLEFLFLQDLPKLRRLPSLRGAESLRRVLLWQLKGLRDYSPLAAAPALEEVAFVDAKGIEPEEVAVVLANPTLKRAAAGFGSIRKNRRFEELREAAGVAHFDWGTPYPFSEAG